MFSAFIPDMHYFKGLEGGRTLPFLHPDGVANLAPKLQTVMQAELGAPVTSEDFLAYVACIASHRGYTETFRDELSTPGTRIPITRDTNLWTRAVELGGELLWAQTFGVEFLDDRPSDVRFALGDPRRVQSLTPIN